MLVDPVAVFCDSMCPQWHTSSKWINAWGDESTVPPSVLRQLGLWHFSGRLHALHYNSCPSVEFVFVIFFPLSSSSWWNLDVKWKVLELFLILQTVDDVNFLSSTGGRGKKTRRIICICLPVIRCISSLSFLFNDWLLQRGPVLLKCNDSPLRRLKSWRGKGGWKKKKLPSFCGFEQPLICTKFRFALLFWDQRLTRSIIQS